MRRTAALIVTVCMSALAACGPNAAPKVEAPAPAADTAAAEAPAPVITVADAFTRATPVGATVAGGYMTIRNGGDADDRLVAVSSPRAPRMEIHEMAMEGGVMSMRPLAAISVPAGGEVSLAPGGLHIMFLDLTQGFAEGEAIPVTLTFETSGAVETVLTVQPAGSAAPTHSQ